MSNEEYSHSSIVSKKPYGIDNAIKEKIKEYESFHKFRPKDMLNKLMKEGHAQPTAAQLNNYLKYLRKNDGILGNKICLDDFQLFYQENKVIPADPK